MNTPADFMQLHPRQRNTISGIQLGPFLTWGNPASGGSKKNLLAAPPTPWGSIGVGGGCWVYGGLFCTQGGAGIVEKAAGWLQANCWAGPPPGGDWGGGASTLRKPPIQPTKNSKKASPPVATASRGRRMSPTAGLGRGRLPIGYSVSGRLVAGWTQAPSGWVVIVDNQPHCRDMLVSAVGGVGGVGRGVCMCACG